MKTKTETALVAILPLSAISFTKENQKSIPSTSNQPPPMIAGKAGKALVLNINASAVAGRQYVHGAAYTIRDPENEMAGYWFDHPTKDHVLSSCVNDQTKEQLNNTLVINGTTIANGRNLP